MFMERAFKVLASREIQRIFDDFCQLFDIQVDFKSHDNSSVLTSGFSRPSSRYCILIHRLLGEGTCSALDAEKRAAADECHACVHYECHAGLVDAIIPISIRGIVVGYAFIGQFRVRNSPPLSILSKATNRDERIDLENAFARLPLIGAVTLERVLSIFSSLIDYICTKEMVTIQGDILAERILSFIQENVYGKASRAECAGLIGRSEETVSQIVKKNYGTTFKKLVLEEKLKKADEIFVLEREISLAKVAERLGFCDQFHFSRIYKKYRKQSPSESKKPYSHISDEAGV
jgi:AraC-like DNA-binding protein